MIVDLIKWLIKKIIRCSVYTLIFLTILIYAPFLLDVQPASYWIPFPEFTGVYAPNDHLSKAEHLFSGQVSGPESLAVWKGDVFSALADGRIIKIHNGKLTTIVDVSEGTCQGPWELEKCGRPLAVKFDSKGNLYVIDPYFGLKRINLAAAKPTIETIFSAKTKVNGKESKFLDDFVIIEGTKPDEGNVYYMTDVSTKWKFDELLIAIVEHQATGRLIKYEEKTKTASIAADNLYFPNGVELNDKKDQIFLVELGNRRILRYYLAGVKKGKIEVLIDQLPGEPDNIRRSADSKRETYWIALYSARTNQTASFADLLSDKPFLRKAMTRFVHALAFSFNYVGEKINFIPLREIGFSLSQLPLALKSTYNYGFIAEIDSNGKIIRTLQSPNGETTRLSEAREVMEGQKRVLYLGSLYNDYVGRLVLP